MERRLEERVEDLETEGLDLIQNLPLVAELIWANPFPSPALSSL
jgi:hypothetical protein